MAYSTKYPKSCNVCEWSKFIDKTYNWKWIEVKCKLVSDPSNGSRLIEIVEDIKDIVRKPAWCPLQEMRH